MADNTNGITIKIDTHDLELTIESLKNAVTGAIKGINTSANDKQSGFEAALKNGHQIFFTKSNSFCFCSHLKNPYSKNN